MIYPPVKKKKKKCKKNHAAKAADPSNTSVHLLGMTRKNAMNNYSTLSFFERTMTDRRTDHVVIYCISATRQSIKEHQQADGTKRKKP
jgi:hypothetical protein